MNTLVNFIVVVAAALITTSSVLAQTSGLRKGRPSVKAAAPDVKSPESSTTWLFRAGATTVAPQVKSGCLSAPDFSDGPDGCTKISVSSSTQFAGGITRMLNSHFSIDVPFALPFTHQIIGDGALKGAGAVGEIQELPFTVFAQYRFMESSSMFRPYAGLGVTYAYFFNPQGNNRLTAMTNPGGQATTFKVDSKVILTPEIGASLTVYSRFFVDAFYAQSLLNTRTQMSTGQHLDADLNPVSYGLAAGYKY